MASCGDKRYSIKVSAEISALVDIDIRSLNRVAPFIIPLPAAKDDRVLAFRIRVLEIIMEPSFFIPYDRQVHGYNATRYAGIVEMEPVWFSTRGMRFVCYQVQQPFLKERSTSWCASFQACRESMFWDSRAWYGSRAIGNGLRKAISLIFKLLLQHLRI